MANDRFQELLRQMPSIANAVNGFQSESIQQMAYKELLAALSSNGDASATAPVTPVTAKAKSVSKPGLSTADILAMARGGVAKPGSSVQEHDQCLE